MPSTSNTNPPTNSTSNAPPSVSPYPVIPQNTHTMVTRANNGIFKPKVYLAYYKEVEPTSAKEALKHNHWRKAMEEEYSALMKNQTWELVTPSPN